MINTSAVLRLKNEGEWLNQCLRSIEDVFDEILLCTQGKQSDNTRYICSMWATKNPEKFKHFHYEFDSRPNGPGHDNQPMDQYNRAYFYNWCFRKAKGEWVCKWDGDMIALPELKKQLDISIRYGTALRFKGIDVVGDLYHIGDREFCATETRFYRKGYYVTGKMSEQFILEEPSTVGTAVNPLFIHTKWAKGEESITKAWPKNWKDIPHFQKIYARGIQKKKHKWKVQNG